MKCDLHIHSIFSDGVLSPTEIVKKCSESGLDVIAVTDHDNADGIAEARSAAEKTQLKVLGGIELSAFEGDTEVHILGYGLDFNNPRLDAELKKVKEMRESRNLIFISRFKELGIDIDYERIKRENSGEVVGRSHMAQELVRQGICSSIPDAFARFLGPDGQAYVTARRLTVKQAINLVKDFGGIAVLAHPSKLRKNTAKTEAFVRQLIDFGLDGIEACYFSHTMIERDFYLYLAERYNLGVFGGSDFHSEKYGIPLGTFYCPPSETADLIISLTEK